MTRNRGKQGSGDSGQASRAHLTTAQPRYLVRRVVAHLSRYNGNCTGAGNMARLEVRLDAERERRLEELAEDTAVSSSSVVRRLIDDAYEDMLRGRRMQAVERLTRLEVEDPPDSAALSRELATAHGPSFYVYENWTQDRARVHRAECPFCNHGRGIHGTGNERNGKWHPPLSGRDAAYRFAHSTRRSDISGCGHCAP